MAKLSAAVVSIKLRVAALRVRVWGVTTGEDGGGAVEPDEPAVVVAAGGGVGVTAGRSGVVGVWGTGGGLLSAVWVVGLVVAGLVPVVGAGVVGAAGLAGAGAP